MSGVLPTMHELLDAYDRLPLLEGRHADLMIRVKGGRVCVRRFVVDRDGTVLIEPSSELEEVRR